MDQTDFKTGEAPIFYDFGGLNLQPILWNQLSHLEYHQFVVQLCLIILNNNPQPIFNINSGWAGILIGLHRFASQKGLL